MLHLDVVGKSVGIRIGKQRAAGGFLAVRDAIAIGIFEQGICAGKQLGGIGDPVIVAVRIGRIGAGLELLEIGAPVPIGIQRGIARIGLAETVGILKPTWHAVAVGVLDAQRVGFEFDVIDLHPSAGGATGALDFQGVGTRGRRNGRSRDGDDEGGIPGHCVAGGDRCPVEAKHHVM